MRTWLLSNMLRINDQKTELIIFANPQQAKLLADMGLTFITFAGTTINASTAVRNLGVALDCQHERTQL